MHHHAFQGSLKQDDPEKTVRYKQKARHAIQMSCIANLTAVHPKHDSRGGGIRIKKALNITCENATDHFGKHGVCEKDATRRLDRTEMTSREAI